MATPNVSLTFEGICAYVPDTPFFIPGSGSEWGSGAPTSVKVLLPDVRKPAVVKTSRGAEVRTPHFCVLLYPSNWKNDGNRQPDAVIKTKDGEMAVVILHKEYLSIKSITDSSFYPDLSIPRDLNSPYEGVDDKSLWWIPRLRDIKRRANKKEELFKKSLLNGRPFPGQFEVIVDITKGKLEVADFNRLAGAIFSWPFASDAFASLTRPIGNKICWSLSTENPAKVEIGLFHPESNDTRTLVLLPPNGSDKLNLAIKNTELDALFTNRPDLHNDIAKESPIPDPDFSIFYDFSSHQGPRPLPDRRRLSFSLGSGDRARPCAPAAFDGFTDT